MNRLRAFNDLAHVAAWLSETTGDDWESLDIVDLCIKHGVIPHVQCLAPPFTDNELPAWALEGSPVELVFNQDLPRFLAGQGVIHMVRHNGSLYRMTPGLPVTVDDLRLSERSARTLLERMSERKTRDAADRSDAACKSEPVTGDMAGNQPDYDDELAALFDAVRKEQLEAMFPDGGKWVGYAERAARNGLDVAREGRGIFNPYRAALWWLERHAPAGWTWARCARVLANNLPPRSHDSRHLLTGDFD